jgi:hypothetical protein
MTRTTRRMTTKGWDWVKNYRVNESREYPEKYSNEYDGDKKARMTYRDDDSYEERQSSYESKSDEEYQPSKSRSARRVRFIVVNIDAIIKCNHVHFRSLLFSSEEIAR